MEVPGIKEKVERLKEIVRGKRKVLIVTHVNPDPDAIASAYALRFLLRSWGVNSIIAYDGIIGRPENRALVRLLRIPLRSIRAVTPQNFSVIAVVDAQPPSNHIPLSVKLLPTIVIDHHISRGRSSLRGIPYLDIRPECGSTSTIIAQYLLEEGIELPVRVATALYYGIKSDTGDLGKEASEEDRRISNLLYQRISVKTLSLIERPKLPKVYFQVLKRGLERALFFPQEKALVSDLERVSESDLIPVVADLLSRTEGIKWTFSLGEWKGAIFFSIRTSLRGKKDACSVARRIVRGLEGASAGGHEASAGGRVELSPQQDGLQVRERIKGRFLKEIGASSKGGVPFLE